jgi:predicted dehydrogenase
LRRSCSSELDDALCFYDLKDAIDFAPQIAVIANPATFHITIARSLAQAGAHLLIEKPLSHSLNGVKSLIELCNKLGIVLLIGYNLRFLPSLIKFKELLHSGLIGAPSSVRCEVGQYLPSWRTDADYRNSVSATRKLGGGVLLELSHELDYLSWIFGEVEWVQATLTKQSNLEIDVEDSALMTLGFSGIHGAHLTCSLNMDFIRHDQTRVCIVIGEKGSLRWNGLDGTVDIFMAGGVGWKNLFTHLHGKDESYLSEWAHFLSCIYNKKTPEISGFDGMKILKIIEAARASSISNGRISIAPTDLIN